MIPLLEIENLDLSVVRGTDTLQILREVSLRVGQGERLGIVGESGSGKTQTLRSIVRLQPRHALIDGTISFMGREVLGLSPAELRRYRRSDVGMVFQDAHSVMNPVRTVGDFMTESARGSSWAARRDAVRRAVDILGRMRIADPEYALGRYPHELSGGMLQRVMIGTVLMSEPRLILADEPTSALDVTTQSEVLALLEAGRAERDAALIMVSHDIEVIAGTCDRIVVMYQGRIVETLTPLDLRADQIKHPYTRALLAAQPDIDRRKPWPLPANSTNWGEGVDV